MPPQAPLARANPASALAGPKGGCLTGGGPIPDPTSRRERKKLATRQALRMATIELIAVRGFDGVTIEAITEAVDVSPRTFFNYFPTKEAAIVGSDPAHLATLASVIVRLPPEVSPLAVARRAALEHAAFIQASIDELGGKRSAWLGLYKMMAEDSRVKVAYLTDLSEVERVLLYSLAERLGITPTEDPLPALLATTVMGAVRVSLMLWGSRGGADSLVETTESMLDRLAEIVAPTAGARRRRGTVVSPPDRAAEKPSVAVIPDPIPASRRAGRERIVR